MLKRAYEAYLRNKEEIEFHLDEIMTAKEFSDFKSMKFQDLKLFENIKYLNYLGRVCEAGESGKHVLMRDEDGFKIYSELIETDQDTTVEDFLQKAFSIKQRSIEENKKNDSNGNHYEGEFVDYNTALKETEKEVYQEQRAKAVQIGEDIPEDEARKMFLFLQSKKQAVILKKKDGIYYSGDDEKSFFNGNTRKESYDIQINTNRQIRFIDKSKIEAFKHLKIADVTTTLQLDVSNYRILNDTISSLLQMNGFETIFEINPFSIKTSFGEISFGLNDEAMNVLSKIETMLKAQLDDKASNNEFKSLEDVFDILPEKYVQEAKNNAEEIEIELDDASGIEGLVEAYKNYNEAKTNYCFSYMGRRIFTCDTSVEEFESKIRELLNIRTAKPPIPQQGPPVGAPPPPSSIQPNTPPQFFVGGPSIETPNVQPPSAPNSISQGITPNTILGNIKNAGITSKEIADGYETIEQSIRPEEDLKKAPYSNMEY